MMSIITEKTKRDLASWLKANQTQVISCVIIALLLFTTYGCDPKVKSISHPNLSVTRSELQIEVDHYLALAKDRFEQLDQQENFRQLIFQNAFIIAEQGTISLPGVITTLFGLFGVGAVVDNRRKTKALKIANAKNGTT